MCSRILEPGFFGQSIIYLNTKQIHLSKFFKIGSIIVPLPVHAKQPGLDGRVFVFGYQGFVWLRFILKLAVFCGRDNRRFL